MHLAPSRIAMGCPTHAATGITGWPIHCANDMVMKPTSVSEIDFFSLISFGPTGLMSFKEKGKAEQAGEKIDGAKDELDDATDAK